VTTAVSAAVGVHAIAGALAVAGVHAVAVVPTGVGFLLKPVSLL